MLRPRRLRTEPFSPSTLLRNADSAAAAARKSAISVLALLDETCELSRTICLSISAMRDWMLSISGWSGFISVRFS